MGDNGSLLNGGPATSTYLIRYPTISSLLFIENKLTSNWLLAKKAREHWSEPTTAPPHDGSRHSRVHDGAVRTQAQKSSQSKRYISWRQMERKCGNCLCRPRAQTTTKTSRQASGPNVDRPRHTDRRVAPLVRSKDNDNEGTCVNLCGRWRRLLRPLRHTTAMWRSTQSSRDDVTVHEERGRPCGVFEEERQRHAAWRPR